MTEPITTLFLDVGGVLLTNGWGRQSRRHAAELFQLDLDEMEERHHLTFDTYEEGKLSLDEYLNRVVFYQPRPFSRDKFTDFMFQQSRPFPEMIDLVTRLKARYGLKIAVVTNEGRELVQYRIHNFGLTSFVDFFISSCFVHFRKPDTDIFQMALDVAQAHPEQVLYIEDRAMFVEVARSLGIWGVVHRGFQSTKEELARFGLS